MKIFETAATRNLNFLYLNKTNNLSFYKTQTSLEVNGCFCHYHRSYLYSNYIHESPASTMDSHPTELPIKHKGQYWLI